MIAKGLLALTLLFAAACHHNTPPTSTQTGSGSATTGSGSAATGSDSGSGSGSAALPGIAEKCGPADACAAGLTCVSYYGIAGARGPQFKTCEIKCDDKATQCPDGRHCATVADGPGRVCR